MSRRALGDVVSGCPPESRVSSKSFGADKLDVLLRLADAYLIYDIEVVLESRRGQCTEVLAQNLNECLKKCKTEQRIHFGFNAYRAAGRQS